MDLKKLLLITLTASSPDIIHCVHAGMIIKYSVSVIGYMQVVESWLLLTQFNIFWHSKLLLHVLLIENVHACICMCFQD